MSFAIALLQRNDAYQIKIKLTRWTQTLDYISLTMLLSLGVLPGREIKLRYRQLFRNKLIRIMFLFL